MRDEIGFGVIGKDEDDQDDKDVLCEPLCFMKGVST